MNGIINFFESIPSAVQGAAKNISSTTNSLTSKITKKESSDDNGEKKKDDVGEKEGDKEAVTEGGGGDTITGAEAWEKWERDHKVPYVSDQAMHTSILIQVLLRDSI